MNVDRLSITLDAELGAAVREAASRGGTSVSAWLADAAADRLRAEQLGASLASWEAESGEFTERELDHAARALGIAARTRK